MKFKALSFDELCTRLCEKKRTLIVYHIRPDADAVGSAFALRDILTEMGIPAICAGADEIPARLSFISEGIQGAVAIDGEIYLDHERVISVDSAAPVQLGSIFDRLHKDIDLMIDHHATGVPYADNYIDTAAAATGEIIFDIAKELLVRGKISKIQKRTYANIYAAISSDTGCFRYANVTPKTMLAGAELVAQDIGISLINSRLFEYKTLAQIKAEGEAARRLTLFDEGRISCIAFPFSTKQAMGLCDEDLETVIDIARSVYGVLVAVAIKQQEDSGIFRVSLRSRDTDAAAICAVFGGGGHIRAAGCTIKAESIEKAQELILNEIRKKIAT